VAVGLQQATSSSLCACQDEFGCLSQTDPLWAKRRIFSDWMHLYTAGDALIILIQLLRHDLTLAPILVL
jgi:hypothetical protein